MARRLQNQSMELRIPNFLRACHHSVKKICLDKYVHTLPILSTLISYLSNTMKASQPILPYCIYPAMQWCNVMYQVPDYGNPESFFSKIPNFWVFFGQFISTHFGTVSSLSMFSINQKKNLMPKASMS